MTAVAFRLRLPHAGCMAIPLTMFKPKRRWMQVSLRTVFVFVTLFCVALSLWLVPAERRRRPVAAIEASGGKVFFVGSQTANESSPLALLRRWLPKPYLDQVCSVYLGNTQVTDAGLAHLKGLTALQGLDLENTQVTDAGLAHLKGLTRLRFLMLNNTHVKDAGLPHFRKLTALQGLWLNGTQVTDAGVTKLRKALPKCAIFRAAFGRPF